MNSPGDIKRRYQRFAEMECKGHSDVYYRLALAVAEDDSELRFLLARTRFTSGRRRDELLACSHPHGGELTWF